jgi:hypothetical protein
MANQSAHVPCRPGSSCVSSHLQAPRATTAYEYGLALPPHPALFCHCVSQDAPGRQHVVPNTCSTSLLAFQE